MIEIGIPGRATLRLETALVDFNGTLACDGRLIDGVPERLRALAARIEVHVVTGDTCGTACQELAGLPVSLHLMPAEGQEAAKLAVLDRVGAASAVAVGNGCNDRAIMERAALSIAVLGGEGCAVAALLRADVACASIGDALDLLTTPRRLVATLRR
jgi:soluble P-type ATPase